MTCFRPSEPNPLLPTQRHLGTLIESIEEMNKGIKSKILSFCEAVLKIYPHYYDLFDVIKDHSSSKPQTNSEALNEIIAEPFSTNDNDDS